MTSPSKTPWLEKLRLRWKLKSISQVWWVLLAFACTGTTVVLIKTPLFEILDIPRPWPWWAYIIYLIAILPVYNLLLLGYGFLFGQFRFFWEFEKRLVFRLFRMKRNL
ncbi:MAG: diacylglyceryl transferase [Flavobacteriales bacterium]|nr:diacylglyceryl transferase [Flavobacteriales bacterium]